MTVYETVEYNAAKDLIIVRNAKLPEQAENELLAKSGWIEMPLDEAADILPPTPGPNSEFNWLSMRRGSSSSEDSNISEGAHQGDVCGSASPSHKHVYKRMPVASELHMHGM